MKKIFLLLVVLLLSCGQTQERISIGDNGIVDSGGNIAIICLDQATHNDYINAIMANDKIGIVALALAGKAFPVDSGTRVKVIDLELGKRKVRIMEGKYSGRAGWVSKEILRKSL